MADMQPPEPSSSPELPSASRDNLALEEPQPQEPMQPTVDQDQLRQQLERVTHSDIGLNTLLTRLKQSIASARDFAAFLKKRSVLEEEHASGLKKLSKLTHEGIRRPEHRQGSFAQSYDEVTKVQDRMGEHGLQFAVSLHQMSDDLQELASNVERGRKHWKQVGTNAEKRVLDAENAMDKAKTKYDSLAEAYDRARTGDRQSGRFGLKGPKSAAQQEEDLNKKLQAADSDYASKVQAAQSQRHELINQLRPQTSRALQDLIRECDSGLTLQLQKFATFNEKLLLGNGLVVSPLKSQTSGPGYQPRSLRDVVSLINNDNDYNQYILSFTNKAAPRIGEIKYEQHPTLRSAKQTPSPAPNSFNQRPQQPPQPEQPPFSPSNGSSFPQSNGPPYSPSNPPPSNYNQNSVPPQIGQITGITSISTQQLRDPQPARQSQDHNRSASGPGPMQQRDPYSQSQNLPPSSSYPPREPPFQQNPSHSSPMLPPVSQHEPISMSGAVSSIGPNGQMPPQQQPPHQQPQPPPQGQPQGRPPMSKNDDLPPTNPVFGVSLDDLFRRDGSAVPMIVYQCVQAIDLFGLEVEGIYRTSGSNPHITELKTIFDHDSTSVDFRDPQSFHHDISSVAGLLKLFFRSLPDPLFTRQHYSEFISAAQIPDDTLRRDSLHAIINALPDPNYATLRVLTLHLNRITDRANVNRMTAQNLAIVFGPTLMGGGDAGGNIRDAGWQAKAVETVLVNTFQIFDDDD